MNKKIRTLFAACMGCFAVTVLFTCPSVANAGIVNGLQLCANVVIPSLFPFMVISGFISMTGAASQISKPLSYIFSPVFGVPKQATCAILLSFISGYPVGAYGIKSLLRDGVIDKKCAKRMTYFCINAGPATVVLAVGKGMLGSMKSGWILLASHIGASVIIGAVTALFDKSRSKIQNDPDTFTVKSIPDAFVESTANACDQMLLICGYVILFAAITELLKMGPQWSVAIAEVTCGAKWAAESGMSLPVISAILGFGGLSVMCQVTSVTKGIISFGCLFISRIFNAAISYIICLFLLKIFPSAVATMSNIQSVTTDFSMLTVPLSISMLLMSATFLFTVSVKK